jgi:hypothetical protein
MIRCSAVILLSNARLLAFKNILKDNAQISATGQLIIKNILKDNAQISAAGQLIIENILLSFRIFLIIN